MPNPQSDVLHIQDNKAAHDRLARFYPFVHPEIYNPTEQIRLRDAVGHAVSCLGSMDGRESPRALDIGAGRGNLTAHLLAHGCRVTAADVSPECLGWISRDLGPAYGDQLATSVLNGADLAQFADNSFDLVGCYSVLHHVPDYLALVREMARVTRPGGVVYMDHESSERSWHPTPDLIAYRNDYTRAYPPRWYSRCLSMPVGILGWYLRRAVLSRWRKLRDPRYSIEGDIHIWPDRRVEWARVDAELRLAGSEAITIESYLGCRETMFPAPVHERHRRRCADTAVLVAIMGNKG